MKTKVFDTIKGEIADNYTQLLQEGGLDPDLGCFDVAVTSYGEIIILGSNGQYGLLPKHYTLVIIPR